jgi:Xaa-Pro aminopeptidase
MTYDKILRMAMKIEEHSLKLDNDLKDSSPDEGNCGFYAGPWGVRVEDTVVVGKEGPIVLTDYPRHLRK